MKYNKENQYRSNDFVPFFKPDIGNEEIEEVIDTLQSGWLTTGPKVNRFEEEFRNFVGTEFALAVNSATAGLHLALEALGIGRGDEVITSTYTFTASAEVARYLGADVVFVDVDPSTLNIDPVKLSESITERTKAIVLVHFAGQACEMDAILTIAREHGIAIVEDAAHALPADYKGTPLGTYGDVGVFSFYANKTITTGEGGMVVTNSKQLAERISILRLHGIDREVWSRYNSVKPSWYYQVVAPGYKYNMSDIMASLGIHQLIKAEQMRQKRQAVAWRYNQELADLPLDSPYVARPTDTHAWHLYIVQLHTHNLKLHRDEFIGELAQRGIGSSVHYLPLHMHKYWQERYHLKESNFPNATIAFQRAVSLPLFSTMSDQQVDRVIAAIRDILS